MSWMSQLWNYSNLRLVSLGLLALWSLLVLAGLYGLKSAGPYLALLLSKLRQQSWQKSMPNSESGSESSSQWLDSRLDRFPLIDDVKIHIVAGLVVVMALCGLWAELKERPVYTDFDVRFIAPTPDSNGYSWEVEDADGRRRMDFCNDYDLPSLNIQPGEVAWKIRYRDMGQCDSIKENDLKIWLYRDKAFWTVETDLNKDYRQVLKEIKDGERQR